MKLLTHPPRGSELVRRYLWEDPEALAFYPGGSPASLEGYRRQAAAVAARFDRPMRERLARILTGGGPEGAARRERWVEEGGFAVTTGQQPGLFGGPLYSLYKALTAAALARRLEGVLGVPVLPVFWVASEDHDWEEVRKISVPDPGNELVEVGIEVPPGAADAPLHRVVPGEPLARAREALLALLPDSDFRAALVSELESTYHEEATLPQAFAGYLRQELEGEGIHFLSPEHPEAQAAALPVLLAEARGSRERARALAERAAALEVAGFTRQVPILEGGVNLFLEGRRGRDRLFLAEDGEEGTVPAQGTMSGHAGGGDEAWKGEPPRFRLRRDGSTLTLRELEEVAGEDPARLSPNVLLRPVVESHLVPTLAYVAGPGEMAYYAQTAPVFEAHGITQPVIHPRLSATVVESKVGKVLEKFDLSLEALARPHHEVAGEILREELPASVRQALGSFRGVVAREAKALAQAVKEVDPTLSGPVDHLRNQSFSLLDEVEKKVVQARKRESGIALAQIAKAQLHLFPGGKPQERVFPSIYYRVRYGGAVMDAWREAAERAVLLPEGGE